MMYAKVATVNPCRTVPTGYRCCGPPPVHMPRYCDLPQAGPEVLGDIIRDLHCVFEKSFGCQATNVAHYRNLESEIKALRDDLMCAECCKEELENELMKLHPELKTLQFALDEEIQRRCGIERIANQLRAQLVRADAMLDADCRDKAVMQSKIKELQAQLLKLQDMIANLKAEREELLRKIKALESRNHVPPYVLEAKNQRCEDLEEALTKCCEMNDALQKQIAGMEQQNARIKADLKEGLSMRMSTVQDCDEVRRQAAAEIQYLQDLISDFRAAIDCLTNHNMEICEKFQEAVNNHHVELQQLRSELLKYKSLYENEARLRAECIEAQQRQSQHPGTSHTFTMETSLPEPLNIQNPCAALIERLRQARPYDSNFNDSFSHRDENTKSALTGTYSREPRQGDGNKAEPPDPSVKAQRREQKAENIRPGKDGEKKVKISPHANDKIVYALHVLNGSESRGSGETLQGKIPRHISIRDVNGNLGDDISICSDSVLKTTDDSASSSPDAGESVSSMLSTSSLAKPASNMTKQEEQGKKCNKKEERLEALEESVNQAEKRCKFYVELYQRYREKARGLKVELVLERGKTSKLRQKLEHTKEQLRLAREQWRGSGHKSSQDENGDTEKR